jgi:hypothetical protein
MASTSEGTVPLGNRTDPIAGSSLTHGELHKPASDLLTVRQVIAVGKTGEAQFTTRGTAIQPDRYSFASQDDLNAYLVTLGGKPERGGIGGILSRNGTYVRRSTDGTRTVTFGEPVLDAISSAAGKLVIGNQTVDLLGGRPSAPPLHGVTGSTGSAVVFDSPALHMTGIVNDAERWVTDDGSYVEYRIRNGRLGFHAWKENYLVYWSMGLEISVWNTPADFEAARITSLEYMSVTAPCEMLNGGIANDFNDTYVDRMDWGVGIAQQPERVAGVCQALWHHRRFEDLVTAGDGCLRYKTDSWPTTFPPDWNTIVTAINLNGSWTDGSSRSAAINVTRQSFSIDMSAFGRPTAHGTVNGYTSITAIFPDDKTYTGQLAAPGTIVWSNGSRWTKVVNTIFDLNGNWTDGSPWIAIINEGPASLTVDMSDFDRPTAHGSIVNSSSITVTFPDDRTYTGTLQAPNTIRWSNGSTWTKKP